MASVGDQQFMLGAGLASAPCSGDSGGPALIRGETGEVVIAGLLSEGSAGCVGGDTYVRLDAADAWLSALVAPPSSPPSACETLGATGRCFGSTAVWCKGGQERGEACSGAATCGWSVAAAGYRCVTSGADPCNGTSDLGSCQGALAVRCIGGKLQAISCQACGGSCARSSATGFAVCEI